MYIDDNNCPYEFTTKTTVHICQENGESTGGYLTMTAELVPPFKSKCIKIPAQTPTNSEVHYTNGTSSTSGKMVVTLEWTVEGFTYEYVGPCGEGLHHDATYEGQVTLEGHDSVTLDPVDVTKIDDEEE